MSVRQMSLVWELPGEVGGEQITLGMRLVLLAIADHADPNGHAFPSHRLIAEKCTRSRAWVHGVVERCCALGLLKKTRQRRPGSGGWAVNLYTLTLTSESRVEESSPVYRLVEAK